MRDGGKVTIDLYNDTVRRHWLQALERPAQPARRGDRQAVRDTVPLRVPAGRRRQAEPAAAQPVARGRSRPAACPPTPPTLAPRVEAAAPRCPPGPRISRLTAAAAARRAAPRAVYAPCGHGRALCGVFSILLTGHEAESHHPHTEAPYRERAQAGSVPTRHRPPRARGESSVMRHKRSSRQAERRARPRCQRGPRLYHAVMHVSSCAVEPVRGRA